MSKVVRGVLGVVLGYGAGAVAGYWLIMQLSTNVFDKHLEAAMTAAFGMGPIGACLGVLIALIGFDRKTPEA